MHGSHGVGRKVGHCLCWLKEPDLPPLLTMQVGSRSHMVEVVYGGRSCDMATERPGGCAANRAKGGTLQADQCMGCGWGSRLVGWHGEEEPQGLRWVAAGSVWMAPLWTHMSVSMSAAQDNPCECNLALNAGGWGPLQPDVDVPIPCR